MILSFYCMGELQPLKEVPVRVELGKDCLILELELIDEGVVVHRKKFIIEVINKTLVVR